MTAQSVAVGPTIQSPQPGRHVPRFQEFAPQGAHRVAARARVR